MVTIKQLLLLCVLLVLSVNAVSAGLTVSDGVQYVQFFEDDADTQPEKIIYDYPNDRILYVDSTNGDISEFVPKFPATSASTSLLIQNMTKTTAIALTTDGNIVIGDTDNKVYLVEDFNGIIDFNDPNDDEYFTLLYTASTDVRDIVVDDNNNIYVSCDSNKIWKLSQPYYTVSQCTSVPTTYNTHYYNLELEETGFLIARLDYNLHHNIVNYYVDNNTYANDDKYIDSLVNIGGWVPSCTKLANGDIVVNYGSVTSSTRHNYIKKYNATSETLESIADYSYTTGFAKYKDVAVDKNGVIYVSSADYGFTMFDAGDIIESAPFAYNEDQAGGDEEPGINTVVWEQSEYTTGDTASLNISISNQKWDTANYTYYLNIYDHASLKDTQTLTEQNSTKTYTFGPTQIASSFLAQARRQHTDGTVETLASGLTSFVETGASYAVTFDKEVYATSDTMTMLYSDAPANTTLYLQGWDDDVQQYIYENTWTVSGSGSESLTVPNPNAESYTVRLIYDGYLLDSDYSEISAATESHLYGVVYNAATGARMEDAEVSIDDTYKLTDEIGSYSWIVETGEHTVSCAEDGFQTITYSDYMISGDKELNFYLSPNAAGDSVYVMVKDYETKAPIQYAHVIVYNDTLTVGDYSSNTGLVELSVPDGTYTLKVVKDGYDNIEKSIDTSASSFFDVLMASGSYNPNAPGAGGLAEDESLTDYYNARFREFAPTAWGFFLLVIVLYLLSILTSFGGSKSRR